MLSSRPAPSSQLIVLLTRNSATRAATASLRATSPTRSAAAVNKQKHHRIHSIAAAAVISSARLTFNVALPALTHSVARASVHGPAVPSASASGAAPTATATTATPTIVTSSSYTSTSSSTTASSSSSSSLGARTNTNTSNSSSSTTNSRGYMTSTTTTTRTSSTTSTATTTTMNATAANTQGQGFTLNASVKHDLFGKGAQYANFRPTYPASLFSEIKLYWSKHKKNASGPTVAIDVGSGTGQASIPLAKDFDRVVGVEGSKSQRDSAQKAANVEYLDGTAEKLPLANKSADLIAVAQAAHWFDLEKFYSEAARVLRPGGCVAIWSYAMAELDHKAANDILQTFHFKVMGPYWDVKRKLVDDKYKDIHLTEPFVNRIRLSDYIKKELTLRDLLNYVGTWSSLKTFAEKEPSKPDPRLQLEKDLLAAYGATDPAVVRVGLSHEITLLLGTKP